MGKLPTVLGNSLEAGEGSTIELGTPQWFDWLNSHQSFRYEPGIGKGFTVRQEKSGKWFGCKKIAGRIHQRYIGISSDLTNDRLNRVSYLLERIAERQKHRVTHRNNQVAHEQYVTKNEFKQLKSEIAELREELRGKVESPVEDDETTGQCQVTELQNQVAKLHKENQGLQILVTQAHKENQDKVISISHSQPDYLKIRVRTLNRLKIGKQSSAGKAINAFIKELTEISDSSTQIPKQSQ